MTSSPGNSSIERDLVALREIDGVEGSFSVGAGGVVTAQDPRLWLNPEALRRVAERISRFIEVIDENFEVSREVFLVLEPFSLSIRWSSGNAVVTLVRATTNLEALKMATNLLLRRLSQAAAAISSGEASAGAGAPSTPANSDSVIHRASSPASIPSSSSLATSKLGGRSPAPTLSGITARSGKPVAGANLPSTVAPGNRTKKKSDIWG